MRDQSHGGYEETTSEKAAMDYTTYVPLEEAYWPIYLPPNLTKYSMEYRLMGLLF